MRDLIILGLVVFIAWKFLKPPVGASNNEVWDWVDYRGNKRTIEVSRHVH